MRLGLRVGEVAALTFDDIDWRAGEMVIHGKGKRADRLPLPTDVGEAIAAYLRRGRRANAEVRSVFVRLNAPHHALSTSGVAHVVTSTARRAGMAYVDLNPIRAAIAKTPEESDYTSIQERIRQPGDNFLRPFAEQECDGIPFNLKDYLELVDWGGREIKQNKRGYIPAYTPPILSRLKMDAAPVLNYLSKADQPAFGALGPVSMLRAFAISVGRSFIKGQSLGKQLCPEST